MLEEQALVFSETSFQLIFFLIRHITLEYCSNCRIYHISNLLNLLLTNISWYLHTPSSLINDFKTACFY